MIDLVRRQLYMDAATRPIERCPSEAHAAVRCPWRRFPCECSRVSTRGSFCAYGGAVLSHRADVDRLAVVRAELLVRAAVIVRRHGAQEVLAPARGKSIWTLHWGRAHLH